MATTEPDRIPADIDRAIITERGRALMGECVRAGGVWPWQLNIPTAQALSLICRQVPTIRRMCEIQCGDGIHSGEWVNDNMEMLEERERRAIARVDYLAGFLPACLSIRHQGDPRGCMLYIDVTDEHGRVRSVAVER